MANLPDSGLSLFHWEEARQSNPLEFAATDEKGAMSRCIVARETSVRCDRFGKTHVFRPGQTVMKVNHTVAPTVEEAWVALSTPPVSVVIGPNDPPLRTWALLTAGEMLNSGCANSGERFDAPGGEESSNANRVPVNLLAPHPPIPVSSKGDPVSIPPLSSGESCPARQLNAAPVAAPPALSAPRQPRAAPRQAGTDRATRASAGHQAVQETPEGIPATAPAATAPDGKQAHNDSATNGWPRMPGRMRTVARQLETGAAESLEGEAGASRKRSRPPTDPARCTPQLVSRDEAADSDATKRRWVVATVPARKLAGTTTTTSWPAASSDAPAPAPSAGRGERAARSHKQGVSAATPVPTAGASHGVATGGSPAGLAAGTEGEAHATPRQGVNGGNGEASSSSGSATSTSSTSSPGSACSSSVDSRTGSSSSSSSNNSSSSGGSGASSSETSEKGSTRGGRAAGGGRVRNGGGKHEPGNGESSLRPRGKVDAADTAGGDRPGDGALALKAARGGALSGAEGSPPPHAGAVSGQTRTASPSPLATGSAPPVRDSAAADASHAGSAGPVGESADAFHWRPARAVPGADRKVGRHTEARGGQQQPRPRDAAATSAAVNAANVAQQRRASAANEQPALAASAAAAASVPVKQESGRQEPDGRSSGQAGAMPQSGEAMEPRLFHAMERTARSEPPSGVHSFLPEPAAGRNEVMKWSSAAGGGNGAADAASATATAARAARGTRPQQRYPLRQAVRLPQGAVPAGLASPSIAIHLRARAAPSLSQEARDELIDNPAKASSRVGDRYQAAVPEFTSPEFEASRARGRHGRRRRHEPHGAESSQGGSPEPALHPCVGELVSASVLSHGTSQCGAVFGAPHAGGAQLGTLLPFTTALQRFTAAPPLPRVGAMRWSPGSAPGLIASFSLRAASGQEGSAVACVGASVFARALARHGPSWSRIAAEIGPRVTAEDVATYYYSTFKQCPEYRDYKDTQRPALVQFSELQRGEMRREEDVCAGCARHGELVLCDSCQRGYHLKCAAPVLREPPAGIWLCHHCRMAK